ncbi:membrane protein [Stenotrophomonas maltophilia]|nr:heparan-alpha-glucosaminide N-acetyltransferase domain-containing protein [Stenotrophomonas pavanii]KOQ79013.1 membrane protein [Stenotrophomonas maltophilia]
MSADDRRLHGLDLARYFALAGMVLVNFRLAMAVPAERAGWLAGFFHLLEGKASATFVTLAGLGLVLATQRLGRRQACVQAWRRALFLLVLGLLNLTLFPADILHYYAVYFALAVLWLRASPRALLASIVGLAAGSFWALLHWDYSQGWNWQTLEYTGLWQWPGAARNLLFNGFHPLLPWMCFFLLGMLLARLQLSQPRVQRALLLLGVLLLGAGQGVQHLALGTPWQVWLGTQPMPPGPAYVLTGSGAACSVIAACLWVSRRYPGNWRAPLTAAGRMTLSLYVGHILLGMGTLEGLGVLDGSASLPAALWCALLFLMLATAAAWLWSLRFARGPLEAVMRRVAG